MRSLLVAALLLAASCRTVTTASISHDIESVVRAQEAAWNRGDVEGFMNAGYWRSPDLTFFSGGDDTRGFDTVLARYVKRYKTGDAEMGKLAFTQLEVIPLFEDAAIVRGRWDLDFEKQPDVGGLFTLVFRRMSGEWRIVHDHTSVAK
jgi:beta-aspartyl-peptidase (threonine type)